MYIRTILHPVICRKCQEMTDRTPLILHDNASSHKAILHDNASSHKANIVKELLESYHWKVLDHPPYSPDLSPPDFDLFPKLKEPLQGIREFG